MYKFDFWKFRGDVMNDRTYADIGRLVDRSVSTIANKLSGRTELKITEFVNWCGCLELEPMDYIEMEEI